MVDSIHQQLTDRREALEETQASEELSALTDTIETRAEALDDVRDDLYGSGVTQSTLRPPTDTHRRRFEALQVRLQEAMDRMAPWAEEAQSYLD